jgi:predicted metalloendopeptidase
MIDWTGIINALIPNNGIKSGPNTTLIVRVPSYYKGLNELISSNVTLQTLQEYFIINYVVYKAQYLDETSSTAVKAFSAQSSSISGSSTTPSVGQGRWLFCATSTSALYKNSIARYYIVKNFGGEAERKKLDSFITTIHNQWIHKLQYNDWLDEQTKDAAIEKVNCT